jgi:hypothetical protein
MAEPPVAADIAQAIDRRSCESAELSFNEIVLLDETGERRDLLFCQVAGGHGRVELEAFANLPSGHSTDSEDIRQGDLQALIVRDVYTVDSGHNF